MNHRWHHDALGFVATLTLVTGTAGLPFAAAMSHTPGVDVRFAAAPAPVFATLVDLGAPPPVVVEADDDVADDAEDAIEAVLTAEEPPPVPVAPARRTKTPEPEAAADDTTTEVAKANPEPPDEVAEGEAAPEVVRDTLGTRLRALARATRDKAAAEEAREAKLAAAQARREARRLARCGEPHDGIDKVEDAHWRVDRGLIDYHTASIPRINALAGGGPYRDGDVKGWQIFGFNCKSPLFQGGLRHRDVILAVNGKRTATIPQILFLWMGQRGRDHFEIDVLRKGETVRLVYDLT